MNLIKLLVYIETLVNTCEKKIYMPGAEQKKKPRGVFRPSKFQLPKKKKLFQSWLFGEDVPFSNVTRSCENFHLVVSRRNSHGASVTAYPRQGPNGRVASIP